MNKGSGRRRNSTNINKKIKEKAHRQAIKEKSRRIMKLYVMVLTFFVCFIYLSYVIIDKKLINGDDFEAKAITQLINGSQQSEQAINPIRGSIVDRNMQSIAASTRVYTIYIDPRTLVNDSAKIKRTTIDPETGEETVIKIKDPETGKEKDLEISVIQDSIEKINKILDGYLNVTPEELNGFLEIVDYEYDKNGEITKRIPAKDNYYQIIAKEVPADKAAELEASNARHVHLQAESKRSYTNNTYASSVIGFIRGDSKMGLEKQYDKYLSGTPGRTFQIYSNEGNIETEKIDAKDGDTVVTTIDLAIQKFSEDAALKYGELYDAKNTSVIVMNPKTGELLSMAAYPSFDLNNPTDIEAITKSKYREEWKELEGEDLYTKLDGVWKNYNITNTFEPGSIFKPITVGAALEENVVSKNATYNCLGSKTILGVKIDCHKTSGHGTITLEEAVAQSCNVAMMEIAEQMGKDIFYKYQKDFGFGEKTGIDLPAESSTTNKLLHTLSGLNPIELATSSFGQRFNATPLQDITAFAATINGGNLMKPYIVSQIIDTNGNVVKENVPTIQRKVISQETSDYLREKMESTISNGTGWKAKIDGWAIGGKTGTGEQGIKDTPDYHYSLDFIAYFPVENPEYVVMVAIDNPNMETYVEGETSPGPMIKEVMQSIIKYKSIPPSYDASDVESLYSDTSMIAVGDYVGKSLDETTRDLNRLSLGYELIGGSGAVISSQFPAAGTKIPKDTVVFLTISNGNNEYEMTTVPNIAGVTKTQAEEMITSLNLVPWAQFISEEESDDIQAESDVSVESDDEYIVEVQMPEADKKVMVGTEVKIKLKKIVNDNPEEDIAEEAE